MVVTPKEAFWTAKVTATVLGFVCTLLLVALVGLTIYGLKRSVANKNQVIREVAGQEVADASWRSGTKALDIYRSQKEAELEEAIASEPVWAESDVPESIADSLRNPNR